MKLCCNCNELKDESDFYVKKSNGRIMQPCKKCRVEYNKERLERNPDARAAQYESIRKYKKTDKGRATRERGNEARVNKYRPIKERNDALREKARAYKMEQIDRIKRAKEDALNRKLNATESLCSSCGETLPRDHFYNDKNGMARCNCKKCHATVLMNSHLKRHALELKRHTVIKRGEKNPLKQTARTALCWAVTAGVVKRPTNCPKCNSTKRVQAHHHDYLDPLDVDWMCELCHKKLHSSLRNPSSQLPMKI